MFCILFLIGIYLFCLFHVREIMIIHSIFMTYLLLQSGIISLNELQ